MRYISLLSIASLHAMVALAPQTDYGSAEDAMSDDDDDDDLTDTDLDAMLAAIFGPDATPEEHLTEDRIDGALARLKQHLLSGEWDAIFRDKITQANVDDEIADEIDVDGRENVARAVEDAERETA